MERLDARPKRGTFQGRERVRRSGQRSGWTASVDPPTGKYELAIRGMVPGEWYDTGQVGALVGGLWSGFCVELEERGYLERAVNMEWTGYSCQGRGISRWLWRLTDKGLSARKWYGLEDLLG